MKIILIASTLLLSITASAHPRWRDGYRTREIYYVYNNCVTEYMTQTGESERTTKTCALEAPMQLSWKTQNYPLLRENPRRVQYWEANVTKEVTTTRQYVRELVDECRGRIISTRNVSNKSQRQESFELVNPNLDLSVKESFMLVPMIEAEAQQELGEAFKRCRAN